jgi:Protein of unknown function (DUF1569)
LRGFEAVERRLFVLAGGAVAMAGLGGCTGSLEIFATLKEARQRVLDLRFNEPTHDSPWSLSQLLVHLAQSVEYSMRGFPEMKNGFVRALAGGVVFPFFNARGAMTHSLTEPIPGAPLLDPKASVKDGVQRLLDALFAFEAWSGPLKPHFAYGELDKAQYTRAHLMHMADHWARLNFAASKKPSEPSSSVPTL